MYHGFPSENINDILCDFHEETGGQNIPPEKRLLKM